MWKKNLLRKKIKDKTMLREELKSHIFTELKLNFISDEFFINEERGVVPNIGTILSSLMSDMEKQFQEVEKNKCLICKSYNGRPDGNLFFTSYSLTLMLEIGPKNTYVGGYNDKSFMAEYGNIIVFSPEIKLFITAKDGNALRRLTRMALSHEITHAYNDYRSFVTTGKRLTDALGGYKDAVLYYQTGLDIEKMCGQIFYLSHRFERNAYISQLRTELESMSSKKMKNTDSITKAITKTESYRKLQTLEQLVERLLSVKDESEQQTALRCLNEIYRKNGNAEDRFKTFNSAVKFIQKNFLIWKKKYMIQSSKIATDVFRNNIPNYIV